MIRQSSSSSLLVSDSSMRGCAMPHLIANSPPSWTWLMGRTLYTQGLVSVSMSNLVFTLSYFFRYDSCLQIAGKVLLEGSLQAGRPKRESETITLQKSLQRQEQCACHSFVPLSMPFPVLALYCPPLSFSACLRGLFRTDYC